MITRKRIKFSESHVVSIWEQMVGKGLTSNEEETVVVIYPGRANGDKGPDFRDAVILDNSKLMKGDVEMHFRSSNWYSHGHHTDAEYNNVILHVVMSNDCDSTTLLQSGNTVPVLCLAEALPYQACLLPYQLPCLRILDFMDRKALKKLISTAGEERFRKKAMYFRAEILKPRFSNLSIGKEAGQVLFRGMMRALGYAKNTEAFEDLADRMPLNYIESRKELTLKQALLLGTAGLLPSQRCQVKYDHEKEVQELEQLWQSAGKKVKTMTEDDWILSHIYPNNFPVRRIIAQSYLLERYSKGRLVERLLKLVEEASIPDGNLVLRNGMTVTGDGYWRDHFDFGLRSKTRVSALLGNSKVDEIVVNIILPFAFSWGELANDAKLMVNAMELYRNYPKLAENCITRHMKRQFCLGESLNLTACHQQGLIHIFRNYCREGRCTQCPLVKWSGSWDSDKLLKTGYHKIEG
jgi:hypothetical protein